jgi:hypothetical protein
MTSAPPAGGAPKASKHAQDREGQAAALTGLLGPALGIGA